MTRPACPVCFKTFPTQHGVSTHFRHRREAGDSAHIAYEAAREDARWTHLTEGVDYVRCLECGHRTVTLARHLKGDHGITADQYRAKYGADAPIRCAVLKAKRGAAISARPIVKGDVKAVTCPSCGTSWQGSKYLGTVHDLRCDACREREDWSGKTDPWDYVTCQVCGYRAENLTSHVQNIHPELVGKYRDVYPGGRMVSIASRVRDKSVLRGMRRSEAFRRKVSQGKMQYLPRGVLQHYVLGNGKVSLGLAVVGLGRCYAYLRRECRRHGLQFHNMLLSQGRLLGLLFKILGCNPHQEWSSDQFLNPRTGRRFKFDGYFPSVNLLVEFHGYQHWTYPNRYHHTEDDFLDLQWRDGEKRRQVQASGTFKYLEVREDDPWQDESYLRGRLQSAGVISV